MKFGFGVSPLRKLGFLTVHSVVGALLVSGCTLSNDSAGGVDGIVIQKKQDNPSPESFAVWAEPGTNLLAAVAQVEETDATTVPAPQNLVLGMLLNEVGAYGSAALTFQPTNTPFRPENMQCRDSQLPEAVDTLCTALQDPDAQLVFIDDTPQFAQHRVLGRRVLQCARDAGFEYLVIEALEESGEALTQRGFVSRTQSGRFMREPQLAGLAEDGLRLGFIPIGLPPTADLCTTCPLGETLSSNARAKATSLEEQTLNVKADAKVLVWTAFGQAYKQPWGQRLPYVESLASFVYEDTGIEPYSVVQESVAPGTDLGPRAASNMYLASGPMNGSCAGSYSPRSGTGLPTLNAVVFHVPPRIDASGGDTDRWDWLHTPAAERMAIPPDCSTCAPNERLLVQVFPEGDISDRVPADQALCAAGAACQLSVPAGDYQIVVWSEDAQLTSKAVALSAGASTTVSMD